MISSVVVSPRERRSEHGSGAPDPDGGGGVRPGKESGGSGGSARRHRHRRTAVGPLATRGTENGASAGGRRARSGGFGGAGSGSCRGLTLRAVAAGAGIAARTIGRSDRGGGFRASPVCAFGPCYVGDPAAPAPCFRAMSRQAGAGDDMATDSDDEITDLTSGMF